MGIFAGRAVGGMRAGDVPGAMDMVEDTALRGASS